MNYLNSPVYKSDLMRSLEQLSVLDKLDNKKIFITGGTGLIGSVVVDLLASANIYYNKNINLFIGSRNAESVNNRFQDYNNKSWFHFVNYSMEKEISLDEPIDYFIHIAGKGNPGAFKESPVEVILQNITSLNNVLMISLKNNSRVVYISTSEVYGQNNSSEPLNEDSYGFVNILSSRACYSSSKRVSETLCAAYKEEYGADFIIIRPGHIYGPTASRNDDRISSAFMYDSLDGKNLIMKSDGMTLRSYCYVFDCAAAIITCMIKGQSGEAYNISNKNSLITIKEMAEYFANAGNVELIMDYKNTTEKEKQNFNIMKNATLDSKKLESLGWIPVFSKEEGFLHSIKILKDVLK